MAGKKTIVLCSSGSFYKHVNQIAARLEEMGYRTVVPATAYKMLKSGDYDIAKVKKWIDDPKHFKLKHKLAMAHFREIAKGDAILIVNDDKPGRPNYIGPNATMEWGVAYYLGKPVYIWKGVPKESNFYEEVYGMSTVIDGDLAKIKL
jgi:nucleoside 2-deoxyribosyltransferase